MVDSTGRADTKRVEAPKADKSTAKSPIRDLIQKGLTAAIQAYAGDSPVTEVATTIASKLLDRAVDSFPADGSRAQVTKFAKGIFNDVIQSIIGDPPTASDPSRENAVRYMSRVLNPVVEAGDGEYKLRVPDHFMGQMLKRFGIGETFGDGIKGALEDAKKDKDCEDLGRTGLQNGRPIGWLKLAQHVVGGILRENNKEGLATIIEAIPLDAVAKAAESKPNGDAGATVEAKGAGGASKTSRTKAVASEPTVTSDKDTISTEAPKAADNGAPSATTRRASASSNAVAMQLAQLSFGAKVKDQQFKVQDLVKLAIGDRQPPPTADQITKITRELTKVLGTISLDQGLDPSAAAATIFTALGERASVQESTIRKLSRQIEDLQKKKEQLGTEKAGLEKDKGPTDAAGKSRLAAINKELGGIDKSIQEATAAKSAAQAAAGRATSYETLRTVFVDMGLALSDRGASPEKLKERSPGIYNNLAAVAGFAVQTFIDEQLGRDVNSTSLNGAVRKYTAIYRAVTEGDALTARERRQATMKRPADAEHPVFYAPLLKDIDKTDLKGSAQRIGDAILAQVPDKSKAPEVYAAIEKALHGCENNIDVSTACAAAAREILGTEDTQLTGYIAHIGSALAAIPDEIKKLETELKNLEHGNPDAAGSRGLRQVNFDIGKVTQEIGELRKQPKSDENGKAIADAQAKLKGLNDEKGNLTAKKGDLEGALEDLKEQQKALEDQSSQLAGRALAFLAYAVVDPEQVKKALEQRDKTPDSPPPPDGNRGVSDGPQPPGGEITGMYGKTEKQQKLIQERVRQCSMILADPTLSTQDKVLLFILVYASYKKAEQEDSLQELTKMDEKRAQWNTRKEQLEKKSKEQGDTASGLAKKVEMAEAKVNDLSKNPANAGALDSATKDLEQLRKALATAQDEAKRAAQSIVEHDQAPEARDDREVRLMLIERDMQEYDHLLQTANGLLEKYDRLIQQIVRSITG